jgi:hypothetical protein
VNSRILFKIQLPKHLHNAFLIKLAVWDFPVDGKCSKFMQSRPLTDEEILQATRQIIGRSWQKETLDPEDVFVVSARLYNQAALHRDSKVVDPNDETKTSEDSE